jgi:hypothetical protein
MVASATLMVSGVVVERTATGVQPISGAQVGLYAWNDSDLTPEALVVSTQSGADGQYFLHADQHLSWIGASKAGYRVYEQRLGTRDDLVLTIELVRQP